jgi:hypothetical protein
MSRLRSDTKCQNGSWQFGFETLLKTRSQDFVSCGTAWLEVADSGGVDFGFIHQKNGDVIADGIDSATLGAFQAFAISEDSQRLLADWANQNVEQILRNHQGILPQWLAASQV